MVRIVTAAVIEKDGCVLLARRAPGQSNAGYWEFPGGKLEAGESETACLAREIGEELGIVGDVGAFIGESLYRYERGEIALRAYRFFWRAGELRLGVHDAVRWATADELAAARLTAADVPLAQRVAALIKSGAW